MANKNYQQEIIQYDQSGRNTETQATSGTTRLTDSTRVNVTQGGGGPAGGGAGAGPIGADTIDGRLPEVKKGLKAGTYNFHIRTTDQSNRETIHTFNIRVIESADPSTHIDGFLDAQLTAMDGYTSVSSHGPLLNETANQGPR